MNKLFLKENIEIAEQDDSGFRLPSSPKLPVDIESLGGARAPSERSQSKPASDFSGTTSDPRPSDSFEIDGKVLTKTRAVEEIKAEVEAKVSQLQKSLKVSIGFGQNFDAQIYQKDFDLLKKLTRFIEHFVSMIKNITLERIATLYRSVVIEKKEPDLSL